MQWLLAEVLVGRNVVERTIYSLNSNFLHKHQIKTALLYNERGRRSYIRVLLIIFKYQIRNFPLYNFLQSKNKTSKMRNTSYLYFLISACKCNNSLSN